MAQPTHEEHAPKVFDRAIAPWLQALLLGLLCLGTFASGLGGDFVLDDPHAILEHPAVTGTAPLGEVFTRNFWGEALGAQPPSFRPLTTLSFALDHRLFGPSPLAFHVSSLLWYVGLVLVGWVFAKRCMSSGAAFLAMALFVVMPVHVENVSSVVGRADTLGVLFSLLALLALRPCIVEGQPATILRLALAALAFVAALSSKESFAVMPLIVALLAESRRRHDKARLSLFSSHLPSLVMFVVLVAYLAVRLRLQPAALSYIAPDDVLVGASLWEKAGYGLELLARYTRLVAVPVGLCTGRKFAEVFRPEHVSLVMAAGAGLLGLGAYVSWRSYRRGAMPFVPSEFVAWLLVTGLVFAMPESMADRFLLLPSLFLCFAIGPAAVTFWGKGRSRQALLGMALAVQVVLSVFQTRTWRNEGTLLSHAVLACPNSLHNHYRYAEYLSKQGETAEAVWHYAVTTKGRHAFPYAWVHPASEAERTLPVEQRLRDMPGLLQASISAPLWYSRFEGYLRALGRLREARLVSELKPRE